MYSPTQLLTENDRAPRVLKKPASSDCKSSRHEISISNRTNRTMLFTSQQFAAMSNEFLPRVSAAMNMEEVFQKRLLHSNSMPKSKILELLHIKETAASDGDDDDRPLVPQPSAELPVQRYCPIIQGQKPVPPQPITSHIGMNSFNTVAVDELRGFRGISVGNKEAVLRLSEFRQSPYEKFNLARAFSYSRLVQVGFLGHESRYDEAIACGSPRLAPFRSRSTRPVSMCMNRVEQIASDTGLQQCIWDASPDGIKIRIRCLWLCNVPGAGMMQMMIPPFLKVAAVLDEYCDVMGINRDNVAAAKIDVREAVRFSLCRRSNVDFEPFSNETSSSTSTSGSGATTSSSISSFDDKFQNMAGVKFLDSTMTLSAHGIAHNDTIDIFMFDN